MRVYFQSKSFIIFYLILVMSHFMFFGSPVQAYVRIDKADEHEEIETKTFEQEFIESNITISKWLNSLTNNIDLFLVGKQTESEANETSVKIENSTYSTEGEAISNQTVLAINPRFPNLEKYWNLKFTTYDEQSDKRGSEKNLVPQTPHETNYGATIGLFRRIGKIRTSFQPRIELQNPLKISHSLAFDTIVDFDEFQINPRLDFFANASKGTGVFQRINFNFTLTKNHSLTLINEGTYEEKTHIYLVTNGFSIGQALSDKNALAYSLLLYSNNTNNYHLDSYGLSVSWYHLFYRKILDLQLTPHLDFVRSRDFAGQLGLTLQLTLSF